jgi:uncharacterized protein YjbI with pentapeptide repeats
MATASVVSKLDLATSTPSGAIVELIQNVFNETEELVDSEGCNILEEHLLFPEKLSICAYNLTALTKSLKKAGLDQDNAKLEQPFNAEFRNAFFFVFRKSYFYYNDIEGYLVSDAAKGDAYTEGWLRYKSKLIRSFDSPLLFGEEAGGVTVAQIYQPLRAYWEESKEEKNDLFDEVGVKKVQSVHMNFIELLIEDWLSSYDGKDRIRLISGGPGSGKSTFMKYLAAKMAQTDGWFPVFVPLQRIRGSGPLEYRIEQYFRLENGDSFGSQISPLMGFGNMAGRWLIIFDGLDELAKDGLGAENAAQEFASSLAEWLGRLPNSVQINFVVSGRAPAMQDARRRLSLLGKGTFFVQDMAPFNPADVTLPSGIAIKAPDDLQKLDQRGDFWKRYAVVKRINIEVPEALRAKELSDLTKEPLLCHLLILSGYATKDWLVAANNRNTIYAAIFQKIWQRESSKSARSNLLKIGEDCFDALMQCLGLASWQGNGRTGNESVFKNLRSNFLRGDHLEKSESYGLGSLSNIAILFYTKIDETEGRGFEFLHKSFGEYLASRALVTIFVRLLTQLNNKETDLRIQDVLARWFAVASLSRMSRDVYVFVRNEFRLKTTDWHFPRKLMEEAIKLMDRVILEGFPLGDVGAETSFRALSIRQNNAQTNLLAMISACGNVAYPDDLYRKPGDGGWEAGPIKIKNLNGAGLNQVLGRGVASAIQISGNARTRRRLRPLATDIVPLLLDRLSIEGAFVSWFPFAGVSMRFARINRSHFIGVDFNMVDLCQTDLTSINFVQCTLTDVKMSEARISDASFEDCNLSSLDLRKSEITQIAVRESRIDRVLTTIDLPSDCGLSEKNKLHLKNIRESVTGDEGEDSFLNSKGLFTIDLFR